MDLLPLSLARRLEVLPRLPEAEVVRFALDVAAALSIAHADGIVHRDIKPDNVMLGSNGEAIVADFGLADAFSIDGDQKSEPGNTGKVMGTPHYFSPEQARGLVLDGRTDLYSLGVMCYRAATGTLPFEGEDWYSVARQHVEDPPVPPRMLVPELTEQFDAIVLRLLAKQPDQRFPSATSLADALLMLPTAPVSRTVGLAPNDASVTQVAFPYVHSVVEPIRRTWRRNTALITLLLAATAAFAFISVPKLNPFRALAAAPDTNTSLVPTTSVDSGAITSGDTASVRPDSVKPTVLAVKPSAIARPTNTMRTPLPPSRVTVTFTAPDSALLLVDNQLVGRGQWEDQLMTGKPYTFKARLASTLPGCRTAESEVTRTFNGAASGDVYIDLLNCGVLLLTVETPDASWALRPLNRSGESKPGRYPGKPQPIVMPEGFYELQVRAERCVDYTDTVTIKRLTDVVADTAKRTIRQICGEYVSQLKRK